jgi:quercetin dioxygenase-like cupin family protein
MRLKTEQPLAAGVPLHFRYQLGSHPGLVAWQDIAPSEPPEISGIDRQKLGLTFNIEQLLADLDRLEQNEWIDHFVKQNYEGSWQAIPLRAQTGATHPIQQIFSNPGTDDYCDTEFLKRSPYFTEVLKKFPCHLLSVRLMKLKAGSRIKEHIDPDLGLEDGYARLHIPITTNPELEFSLNGKRVVMNPGECLYLRLSDPHYINNNGDSDRIHIVLDMKANAWLSSMVENAQRVES